MSLINAITDFKTGTEYTVTRQAANSVVAGRVVDGATSSLSIVASVTPVTGKALTALPEAYHEKSVYQVITATALQTQTAASGAADRISIDGVEHVVNKVQVWGGFGEIFYRAIAVAEPS